MTRLPALGIVLITPLACGDGPCGAGLGRDASGTCVALYGDDIARDTGDVSAYTRVPLDAPRLLRRASLDLRGVLPSVEELDMVEADPSTFHTLRDQMLDDPRLEDRLVQIFNERWYTRVDDYLLRYLEYPATHDDPTSEYEFERAIGEEPLRLMAHIATLDRPWTDIVTADYTVANPMLASIWPVERDADGDTGWAVAHYTDGRPAAGVLATSGLWWRYYTTSSNMNRGRAAAIARLLVCADFLARPISFSSEGTSDTSGSATLYDPNCVSCHASLDPIAANLFGFQTVEDHNGPENTGYHPEREAMGPSTLGVEPAWYGQPVSGLAELGQAIAVDERFLQCAADQMSEGLWRRPATRDDFEDIQGFRDAFARGDLRMRALITSVTDHETYQAGTSDAPHDRTTRTLSPDQLASVVQELTGFRWQQAGFDQMDNDTFGYRTMAGGVDGLRTTSPAIDPSMTGALVLKRLAEAGADTAVAQRMGDPGGPLPLSIDDRPGEDAFDDTVSALHWRLYARRPTAAEVTALGELWLALDALDGPEAAWTGTLSAMLRHPDLLAY